MPIVSFLREIYMIVLTVGLWFTVCGVSAQTKEVVSADTIGIQDIPAAQAAVAYDVIDSLDAPLSAVLTKEDSLALEKVTKKVSKKAKRDWATWKPDPKRAMWLALVLPGAGQIFNRKYWKLPIIYGGFVGCAYAMRWNDQMYSDYSQAYLDLMDDDPTTQSYNQFMHLGMQITPDNEERYKQLFKSRKDRYRRWRDMSFFCMIGVYALSVIDAFVDASLSQFDISDNLSLHVEPGFVGGSGSKNDPLNNTGVGVQCRLRF